MGKGCFSVWTHVPTGETLRIAELQGNVGEPTPLRGAALGCGEKYGTVNKRRSCYCINIFYFPGKARNLNPVWTHTHKTDSLSLIFDDSKF